MWTVVPGICDIFTAPHIPASIFNWTYLRCYWRYLAHSMSAIPQTWCQIQRTSSSSRYVNCGPNIYNVFTAQHIQASIFNWTYLRRYWRYLDNSMSVILQIWCQIQCTSSSFRFVNCADGRIQCIYSLAYSGFNILLNVPALLLDICRHFGARCNANFLPNTAHIIQFTLCELWSRHIQCIYSSAYSGFNIQLNVPALLLEISWQFNQRYTSNLVPNIAHILQFTLCELWFRTYTMLLLFRIFRLQYSTERICAAIAEIFRHFDARCTAIVVPKTAHILQFMLCVLWSPTFTMYLQLRMFRFQY
jgi:hypothetical protein